MARLIRARWAPTGHGLTRRDRRGCEYEAYVPDPLMGWDLSLPADLVADLADAEEAIRVLQSSNMPGESVEGMARFLLRAESVASSRIEGLNAGPRRLIEAEALLARGGEPRDRVAVEILGNIDAMQAAINRGAAGERIGLDDLVAIHRTLMSRSPTPELAGVVRTEQNWIGGSSYNPCSAAFVPPPPGQVGPLLDDLVEYLACDDHPALVQAALAHAQFETIHPFADGNGRTGRALIHAVLRRRGLVRTFPPPVSLVLATWSDDYIGGLTAFRHLADAGAPERSAAAVTWLRTFIAAMARACADALSYSSDIREMIDRWSARLGTVRRGSSLARMLEILPGVPLVTVDSAARLIGRSDVAAGAAMKRLVEAGILLQRDRARQRYRIFEAPDVLQAFTALEQRLARQAPG